MSDLNSFGFGQAGSVANAQIRNKVLRNTYALLALSMVPTVIGAWLGVAMGFSMFEGNPFMGFVVFMAVAIGFFWAINRNKDSGLGVLLLLGFTFFMGVMLSRLIGFTLGTYSNGATLIMGAFGGTALIFTVMVLLLAGIHLPVPVAVSELQLLMLAGVLFLVSGRKLW
jgi:modulator of FtsH protease